MTTRLTTIATCLIAVAAILAIAYSDLLYAFWGVLKVGARQMIGG